MCGHVAKTACGLALPSLGAVSVVWSGVRVPCLSVWGGGSMCSV